LSDRILAQNARAGVQRIHPASRPTLRWCGRNKGYQWEFELICRRTTSPLCRAFPGWDITDSPSTNIQSYGGESLLMGDNLRLE